MEDDEFLDDYDFEDDEHVVLNNGRLLGGIRRENRLRHNLEEDDERRRL